MRPDSQSRLIRTVLKAAATTLVAGFLGVNAASAETAVSGWPETVVALEELRPLTPFELRVAGLVTKGRVLGPATLRVHVNAAGTVARAVLLESCGNADLDEAALLAMRRMRFKPYTYGGNPTEVTLVVPVHVPKRLGRSH
jgi:TonB family protein